MLPGAMYDAEAQCHFTFPDSKVCQQPSVKFSRISRNRITWRSNHGTMDHLANSINVEI